MKQKNKLTQKEMAKNLGITRIYLNYILNNKMRPGIRLAEKISQIEGMPSFFKLRPDLKEIAVKHFGE